MASDQLVPASFLEWTLHNANAMIFDHIDAVEEQSSLHKDMIDYATYLKGIPTTCTAHRQAISKITSKYNDTIQRLFHWEVRTFDFIPVSAHAPFTSCVRKAYFLGAGHVPAHAKWYKVVAAYAESLDNPDDRAAFLAARQELAINDRRELEGKDRRDRRSTQLSPADHEVMDPAPLYSIFDALAPMANANGDLPFEVVSSFFDEDIIEEDDGLLGSRRRLL